MSKYYVGDIGIDIIVDCGSDITGATDTKLKVKKPGATTTIEWEATIYNSNYLKYTIVSGDLNVRGRYKVQASLTLSGWTGLGETAMFVVNDAFT